MSTQTEKDLLIYNYIKEDHPETTEYLRNAAKLTVSPTISGQLVLVSGAINNYDNKRPAQQHNGPVKKLKTNEQIAAALENLAKKKMATMKTDIQVSKADPQSTDDSFSDEEEKKTPAIPSKQQKPTLISGKNSESSDAEAEAGVNISNLRKTATPQKKTETFRRIKTESLAVHGDFKSTSQGTRDSSTDSEDRDFKKEKTKKNILQVVVIISLLLALYSAPGPGEEPDFTPNCTIILKDAIHAIKRARTNYCKKELANIACKLQSNELFPKYLPQFCPTRNVKKKTSVDINVADPNQKSVRIAFLLTFNGRSVRQITRLIKGIYSHQHIYFIHIDKRLDYLFEELLVLETLPNIHLSRNRLSTIWGGASLLEMLINSFNELLRHKNWDYLINLSESDFPIKPLQSLENFLAANYGQNFVKSHGQDPQRFIMKQGLDKTFHQCDDHMWRLGDRKIPEGIEVGGGSDWVALTRDFCQYIVDNDDELLKGLRTFFKYTLLPAETFFHTVLRNSAFCDTVIDNNLHITNWRRSQGCKCQYRHIVDWCGCSPNDFRLEDWSRIVDSLEKPLFFARKFEPAVNQEIINRIEMLITKKQVKVGQLSYDKYWQNDFHHKFDFNDDAKVSFYYLLGLLGKFYVYKICSGSKIPSDQLISTIEVKQSHLFFENDSFKGLLLTFIEKNSASFYEIYAQPIANSNLVGHQISPEIKLISAKVCSDYDMKEQIFRNFACTLHPFSEIGVNHKWSSDGKTNFSVSFVWTDPVEHVAGSFEVQIEWPQKAKNNQQTITLYHKPNFNHPLRPGTWKLSILYKWKPILEMKFLVLPYIFEKGLLLNKTSASNLHNGPVSGKYLDHNFTAVERLLKLRTNSSILDSQAIINSQKTNSQLIDWSFELLENFWKVSDICLVNKSSTCQRAKINSCQSTPWSSFYPDLKSKLI